MEYWKDIKGYEGLYQVSNLGRVKSLGRIDCTNHYVKERILIPILLNNYYSVNLSIDGKHKLYRVHRLVAEAFIPNPNNYPQVNHKNEIKTDNRVENLEWCSARYNVNYGHRAENASKALINHPSKSTKVNQYTIDGEFVAWYPSTMEAERHTGTSHTDISRCCRGVYKSASGFKWSYADFNNQGIQL